MDFVEKFPELSKDMSIFSFSLPAFKILQHGSTVIGGLIILVGIIKLPRNKNQTQKIDPQYWIIFSVIIILVLAIRLLTGLDYKLYGQVIVNLISAILIALIITPLILRLGKRIF